MHPFRTYALFLLLALTQGCSVVVVEGVDPWIGNSGTYTIIEIADGVTYHPLVLTSVVNACSKEQAANTAISIANAEREERLADGEEACRVSLDYWQAHAAAFYDLEAPGSAELWLEVRNNEEATIADITAPHEGQFLQDESDFVFTGGLNYLLEAPSTVFADALTCEDGSNLTTANAARDAAYEAFYLVSGTLDLIAAGDGWDVTVDAELNDEADDRVGSISTSFTAKRCDEDLSDE